MPIWSSCSNLPYIQFWAAGTQIPPFLEVGLLVESNPQAKMSKNQHGISDASLMYIFKWGLQVMLCPIWGLICFSFSECMTFGLPIFWFPKTTGKPWVSVESQELKVNMFITFMSFSYWDILCWSRKWAWWCTWRLDEDCWAAGQEHGLSSSSKKQLPRRVWCEEKGSLVRLGGMG